jgi:sigma-B regulation protein RsbU (phosphoserine phosphatase)
MESGEPLVGKIEKLVYPTGRVAWDYTTKLPLRNSRGEVIGICGINKDFTKVKEMEDALQEERDRLRVTMEELAARNAQIESDLQMARKVQEALLPKDYASISHSGDFARNALSFAHCYLPAAAVGGDLFHIFPLPDEQAGVFICDVMGHGVRAALITAIIRALLDELRPLMLDPGQFMSALNVRVRAILERTDEPFVATAFYAIADPAREELRFANAAHPAPVRLRRGEGVVGLVEENGKRPGPALGLFDATYQTVNCPFAKTDRIVLFTDGAFEVDSPSGEEFGREALVMDFGKHAGLPAAELFAAVLDDVKRFAAKPEFDDDVCFVACEYVAG